MKKIMALNKALRRLEEIVMIIIVGGMTILLISNVVFRLLIQDSISFAEELGAYLLVAATYMGSAYAVRRNKHIKMTAFIEMMPKKFAKIWDIIANAISCVLIGYFGYLIFKYMLRIKVLGSVTAALLLPRWIPVLPVVIGLFATSLQLALLVAMNLVDKNEYWIGTERRYGQSDDELERGFGK